ncbi:MAG: hypothetical protein JXR84_15705 [Anaerolineae bacterium]|nr:hypothetical protein [Anaerolineae bacterium]
MTYFGQKPFGIYDIKLTDIAGAVQVDLPYAQTMTFNERLVSGELRGDGKTVAVVSEVDAVEASLEAGGISLEAYALMSGRTVSTSGTTPTRVSTLTGSGAERFPYFKIYGKSLADGDDDVHIKLFKCKLTNGLEGSLGDGEFMMSNVGSIICIDDSSNGIFDIVQNETADDLPAT